MSDPRNTDWDAIAARIPRIPFNCYVCDAPAETYLGVLVYPPKPETIPDRHHIEPVATCGACYCERVEGERQQTIFEVVMAGKWHPFTAAKEQKQLKKQDFLRPLLPAPVPVAPWCDRDEYSD